MFIAFFRSPSCFRYISAAFFAIKLFVAWSANLPKTAIAFSAAFYAPVSGSMPCVDMKY